MRLFAETLPGTLCNDPYASLRWLTIGNQRQSDPAK